MVRVRVFISAAVLLAFAACGDDGSGSTDGGGIDASVPTADASPVDASVVVDASIPTNCDPVSQQGCDPGQKCSVIPGTPARIGCVSDLGTIALRQSCTVATAAVPDQCAPGLVCRGETTPVCQEFCDDSPSDTCSGAQACVFEFDIDGDFFVDYELCGASCDVLQQDCIAGHACYPSLGGEICAEEGGGSTPVSEGGMCPFANSCEVGTGCFRLGAGADWLCFKICDPSGDDCALDQICNPVAGESWGLCIASP